MGSEHSGLTSAEAATRLAESGPNVITAPARVTFLGILWEEVREPMILLLLVVGVLYSLFGEVADAITIFAVILLLILAEVQNEFRAKRAIQSLSRITSPKAALMRDGGIVHVDAADVVVGDVLVLTAGTKVPADGTIVETAGLDLDESAITGESLPAHKSKGGDVFAGTVVLSGEGLAEVAATGKATQIGKLAEGLKTVKPPRTPLQKAMRELSGKLVWVAVFFSVAIPVVGVLRGQPLKTMLLTGLSLSFATIPEELPIIITMVLGLGAYRLSKQAFLVKRLSAAESMGAVDVIVTDKTGTLTTGDMTLTGIDSERSHEDAVRAAMGAVSEIDATPIDLALKARAHELGVAPDAREIVRRRDVGEGSKTRAVLRSGGDLYVNGAPEQIFGMCASVPTEVRERFERETAQGKRLIGVAASTVDPDRVQADWSDLERDLTFVALLSFSDPPRPEVPSAIAAMKSAGVATVMVTGDYPATALEVAREVGIVGRQVEGASEVVTGDELDAMDDAALGRRIGTASVFARTTPQHKYRIVEALQRQRLRVAATGDGINDALAIKGADVGIAMGIRGTDVAKEAADAVLGDDDYATIANAIFEGRVFYDNLRKGVKYYLSVKIALISVFLLPAVFGLPMPFSPVQIILLELFMDLAASAGFVAEPAEPDIHSRPPEETKRRLLDAPQLRDLFVKGFFLFAAVIAAFFYARARGMTNAEQVSIAFTAWMIGHVALAFVSRSDRQPLARVGLLSNRVVDLWALATAAFLAVGLYVPPIGARLNLVPLPVVTVLELAAAIAAWMSVLEIRKYLRHTRPARARHSRP